MFVHREIPERLNDSRPVVCSIGTFDGIHLGHQRIIGRMIDWAGRIGGQVVAITFARNPQSALKPGSTPVALTDENEKLRVFGALGIDRAIILEFTPDFAGIGPEDFVRRLLVPALKPVGLVLGPGHRFGRGREGSWSLLSRLSKELGFKIQRVRGVRIDGDLVSSTRIRRLVADGDFNLVRRYMGRPFRLIGRVIEGDRQGIRLGYPTANLRLRDDEKILPPDGVYVVRAGLGREIRGGVMYIGMRPTFRSDRRQFEIHLFDYRGSLYGKDLTVFLLERLRGDMAFPDAEALKRRIKLDETEARDRLGKEKVIDDAVPEESLLQRI